MIALFGHDEYSVLGIASLLDVDKIPYRRLSTLDDGNGDPLIVAGTELSPMEIARLERHPVLVLNGGTSFAQQVFGATTPQVSNMACSIALSEPVWPAAVTELARRFGKATLRIPLAPTCETSGVRRGAALASLSTANGSLARPAILRFERCVWSAVDLGAAFANLLTENYFPQRQGTVAPSWLGRASESAYYAVPHSLRRWVQSRYYARLERRLAGRRDCSSDYPIDATGWLLIELVERLIILTAGALVRLERWPAPYRAAATLTHDLEPMRYAYTTGLDRLLSRAATMGYPATLGLVAAASDRYLTDAAVGRLRPHDALCHGLAHRGENVHGRAQVSVRVQTARRRLERRLGRRVAGYRSPRLDRSADLAWALDQNDFQYDSSYPDVDRENIAHFGAGVRLNLPYRPLVGDAPRGLRPSRCLELPLTAPDCVQPLFAGQSQETLRAAVAAKAAFVRQTGGLYVALVHAGVFGEQDAAVREAHLEFVYGQLRHADTWLASMDEIAKWWCGREALQLYLEDGALHLRNTGQQPMAGVRVLVEHDAGGASVEAPRLAPGQSVRLTMPHSVSLPAA